MTPIHLISFASIVVLLIAYNLAVIVYSRELRRAPAGSKCYDVQSGLRKFVRVGSWCFLAVAIFYSGYAGVGIAKMGADVWKPTAVFTILSILIGIALSLTIPSLAIQYVNKLETSHREVVAVSADDACEQVDPVRRRIIVTCAWLSLLNLLFWGVSLGSTLL